MRYMQLMYGPWDVHYFSYIQINFYLMEEITTK
jgi:hypothetical protein